MTDRLFLDDLHVGQRFNSKSHVVDADQIKRFAVEFDPQPLPPRRGRRRQLAVCRSCGQRVAHGLR
jgi:hypothetical protein